MLPDLAPAFALGPPARPGLLGRQEFLGDRFECVAGALPVFGLLAGRILPEHHLRMELGSLIANAELDLPVLVLDRAEALRRGCTERQATLLVAQCVLENPFARATGAQPQTESRDVVVPH